MECNRKDILSTRESADHQDLFNSRPLCLLILRLAIDQLYCPEFLSRKFELVGDCPRISGRKIAGGAKVGARCASAPARPHEGQV